MLKKNNPLWLGLSLEILVLFASYFEASTDITHFFQASARLSGRVSLLSFGLLFFYCTVNRGFEKEILLQKYIYARDFAILHIIHWFFLATAVQLSGFGLVPSRVLGGSVAYLMIVVLPFILSGKILKNLSLKWAVNIYLSYVWFIFLMTYITRITGKALNITGTLSAYWILFCITLLAMFWRIYKMSLSKK